MDRIKFENISDDSAMANGTSLQGYLRDITTRQLIEMFGEPNMVPSGDGKVTCEWIIKTEITDEDGEPVGIFTERDFSLLTSPVPEHFLQGLEIVLPVPEQALQVLSIVKKP